MGGLIAPITNLKLRIGLLPSFSSLVKEFLNFAERALSSLLRYHKLYMGHETGIYTTFNVQNFWMHLCKVKVYVCLLNLFGEAHD